MKPTTFPDRDSAERALLDAGYVIQRDPTGFPIWVKGDRELVLGRVDGTNRYEVIAVGGSL